MKWNLLILFISVSGWVHAQNQTNERAKWFVDDRFGMFIHWGLYSGAEGIWKGEHLRYKNDYAEWIQYRNRISKEEYLTLLDRFDWESINVEEWVLLAKKAGMKYITLTAKHHDGFALWNSKSDPYNIYVHSNAKRDIVKELAEACKKNDLKMGLYYSHWIDWGHPYGWDHTNEVYPISAEQYDQYWQQKVMPQMRELLTDYGDIGMIWFDMWIHHSKTIVTKEQLFQLKTLIRELQPDCLINSRLGLSIEEDSDVDFRTLGDNQLGNQKLDYPWQTPGTVAHSWGFNAYENQWKSTTSLLKALIGNVSLNGNYMLNIGPRANGDVPYEISIRLTEMGKWLAENGEAIYGAGAFDLKSDQHDWGNITYKKDLSGNHKVYLLVFNWPLNKKLVVTGIRDAPKNMYLLADQKQTPLGFEHNGVLTIIHLPDKAPDPYVSVLVLEYDKKPSTDNDFVAQKVTGGFSLTGKNVATPIKSENIGKSGKYLSIPKHTIINGTESFLWEIFIDKPQTFYIDASYSFQGTSNKGSFNVRVNGKQLEHSIANTGKTVYEPGRKGFIDNYKSHRMGIVQFDRAGYYDIQLDIIAPKEESVNFQWLWLENKK